MKLQPGDSWKAAAQLARREQHRLAQLVESGIVPSARGTTTEARIRHAETDDLWRELRTKKQAMVWRLEQNKIPRPRKR